MSAPSMTPQLETTLDTSGSDAIPLTRLVQVEMRKMSDTRAGFWLLAAVVGIAVLVIAGFFLFGDADQRSFLDLMTYAGGPFGFMLPVLGILLVTQEWGQRTALVTFSQVPRRGRIIVAKLLAATALTVAALVVVMAVAAPLALVGGADEPFADFSVGALLRILLGILIGTIWGVGFGMLFLNSAFAIVLYFIVPTIISIISGIWTSATDWLVWFDLNMSSTALFEFDQSVSGKDWAQMGTGALIWLGIPIAIGTWRILRAEVK